MNRFKEISMGIAAMLIVPAISINASPNNIAGKPASPAIEVMQSLLKVELPILLMSLLPGQVFKYKEPVKA